MSPKYKKITNTINTTLTQLPDTDKLILLQAEDIYSLCQTNKYLYKLCMGDVQIKQKYIKHKDIHERLNQFFDYVNKKYFITYDNKTSDFYNIQVKYDHTDFYIQKYEGKFHIKYRLKNGPFYDDKIITQKELYQNLFNYMNDYNTITITHETNQHNVDPYKTF